MPDGSLTVFSGHTAPGIAPPIAPTVEWLRPPFHRPLVPGGNVTPHFQQQPAVWAALTVDEAGRMNVVRVDANKTPPAWQGPERFGGDDLVPGAPVTPLFQQEPAVWAAQTVGQNNDMNVVRVDATQNPPVWHGPEAAGSYETTTLAGADKTCQLTLASISLQMAPCSTPVRPGATKTWSPIPSELSLSRLPAPQPEPGQTTM